MLLPFTINPPADPSGGDPPSDPIPTTRRSDATQLLAHTEPPPRSGPRAHTPDLGAVFAASPVAIVTLDPEGMVTLWNPAAETTFGIAAAEAIGKRAPDAFLRLCGAALTGGTLSGVEMRQTTSDGGSIDLRASIAPLRDSTNAITGVVAMFVR